MNAVRALALLPLLAACGDGTGPDSIAVAELEIVAGNEQWAAAGGALTNDIVVQAVDSRGLGVGGVRIAWSASSFGQATPTESVTDGQGRASSRWRLGTNSLRQTLTARVRSGPSIDVKASMAMMITASGRAYTLDGAAPGALTFSVRSLTGMSHVAAGTSGGFQIDALVAGDSVDYIIEGAQYHTAVIRAAAATTPDLRVVLVPLRWTIDRGSYAGTTVPISPDAAFQPPCVTPGDTNCDGFYPGIWATGLKLWPATALPIRLAFDRVRSNQPISSSDSSSFWSIVDRMNADFGSSLFRAARYDELTVQSDGRPDHAVLVRVDTTLTGFGAWTNWWWDGAGELTSGVVRPARATSLRSSSLMTHELLHTQGFKHSCSWVTVMGGYGCSSSSGLSPTDVAHAHVAVRMRDVQKQTGAPHGLIAAMFGERAGTAQQPSFAAVAADPRFRLLRTGPTGPGGDSAH